MADTVMTPIGVINFPAFFSPQANRENPKQIPRYSGMLLLDSTGTESKAYQNLRAGVMAAIKEKWGDSKAADNSFVRSLRLPFRDAAEKSYEGFDDGEIFFTAWSNGYKKEDENRGNPLTPPDVIDLHGNNMLPDQVWSGQLGRFTVRPFAYDNNGNRGVSLGLEHVQIVKTDMPRIDGRRSADTAFAAKNTDDDDQLKALGIDGSASASNSATDDLPF